ncbi:MAG: FAD-dependent oxidoreductase [Lachnospiraceae bacterium]|nr:FAD-dependent oxidoreductase [Lachnospiraceae bacterium]
MSTYVRINQLKLNIDENEDMLLHKAAEKLKINDKHIIGFKIVKKSIDARKKNEIMFSYSVEAEVANENLINSKVLNNNIMLTKAQEYVFPKCGNEILVNRPVIIGSGPAGLFCGYFLALKGYKPIIIERGQAVDERTETVEHFFKTGKLDTESNVQFGEGGAGTFSDGKLNTTVKDPSGRNMLVLDIFVKFGADKSISYINKPHIGTDVLCKIVKNIRNEIIKLGGEVHFSTRLDDINEESGKVKSVVVTDLKNGATKTIDTDVLVLAIGHSARDTFKKLYEKKIYMEPKPFAMGVRVEHKQNLINRAMYGEKYMNKLGAADYKVTYTCENGRGVYSFCMCPGGYVVNASSEDGRLAVNGMSYSKRDGENANSAIIVTVRTDDYGADNPLNGIEFQRKLEENAYKACGGKIPVQKYGDFITNTVSNSFGKVNPNTRGEVGFADINLILPEFICDSIKEAMPAFGRMIEGFDDKDTLMLAVESRTSSPVRIVRNENYVCNIEGIYPCGEGAGYAGGITSAAIDGVRVFEAICQKYKGNLTEL